MTKFRNSSVRLWLVGIVSAFVGLGSIAQAQIADGLVAYWNFDEGDFTDSFGIFDGTQEGTPDIQFVASMPGFGSAIKMDGENQHILITGGEPDDLAFAGGSMSIAGWFKVDAFDTDWQALIAKGEGTNWRVHRRAAEASLSYSGGVGEGVNDAPDVNDGQWHHFAAITEAGVSIRLWIDGAMYELGGVPTLAANGQRVRIGENPDARNREWEGELDDLAIWNRVLTPDEIAALSGNALSALLGGEARPSIRITANAVGFELTMTDVTGAEVDSASLALTLNGTAVSPTVAKVDRVTTATYSSLPDFLPSGSTNALGITAQVSGETFSDTIDFIVTPFVELDPAWIAAASEYDTGSPGFAGSVNQIAVGRTPGDANSVWNALRHLAGGYIDPASGNAYANLVDPAGGAGGVDADGNFEFPDGAVFLNPWVNINQGVLDTPATEIGRFTSATGTDYADYQIPGIPGTTLSTDNAVAEIYSYIELEGPNLYTFVVNSDDGFRVSFGPELRSAIFTAPGGASTLSNAGQYSGGKGSSDVQFHVAVPGGGSGVYRTRLLWWEGGGGANLEFFTILDDGSAALVGDTTAGGLTAYKPAGAVQPLVADIVSATPWPGQTDVAPDALVQIIISDGTAAVVDGNSITVSLNGVEPPKTATKVGDKTRVTVTPAGLLDAGAVYQVEVNYTAGAEAKSASYSFTVLDYPTLPPALGTAPGTGSGAGMRWRTHQIATARPGGNTIAATESQLAGDDGASVHNPAAHTTPEGADGFFLIDWVNFDQGPAAAGNFSTSAAPPQNVADEGIPGIPGTTGSTDNIAAEALAFLELDAGFHRMVVNSDDGFLVTMGTADVPKHLSLGLFDAGRGAADTLFFFNVEQAGVYFFRLLWFEGGGGANVEWFTVNDDGTRALIGGEQTGSIPAFRTRTVPEPEIPSEASFNPPTIAGGQVTLTWTGTGTLQESSNLTDWSAVTPAPTGNTYTVTPDAANPNKYYRLQL